ncbi:NAD(P)/FAD-dependent oxidoreductase [Undibacterium curvum]|uniref:NAD(P)/FAD-dependent oxidoreductase n=1 Tax=Undibacterium curvum TaxID=2762294 RepID=A0ABR7A3Y4_9BURK|nr:FAD/NAD(P)-binding oxidoreductase [Undibacterium curvum]MBC3931607.1 NAD(P)/FAD-dependent oxidoreductase [Undibacterium curvum]
MKQQEISAPILIIGAGPAGLAAASAALQAGVRIVILDENTAPGGQIWRGGETNWKDARAHAMWQQIRTSEQVQYLPATRIVALQAQTLVAEQDDQILTIRWEKLILCSGAREILLPFPGWTLPGVMGAGGLQALVKAGASLQGKRVVIAGSGPLLLAVAQTAQQAGAQVLLIAEDQPWSALRRFFWHLLRQQRAKAWQALGLFWSLRSIRYRAHSTVLEASGQQRLQQVRLRQGQQEIELSCDVLACGYGLTPNLELAHALKCALTAGKVQVDAQQMTSVSNIWAAGEVTGIGGVEQALIQGQIAGLAATTQVIPAAARRVQQQTLAFAHLLQTTFSLRAGLRALCKPDTLVCRCEDVSAARIQQHADWRTAKLVTRAGMGPCQGRICGTACEFLYGWEAPQLRQPVFPAKTSTLAALAAGSLKETE